MLRQIRLLVGLQQCNVFGINEMRHTKDEKKKQRMLGLGIMWLMLFGMLVFYIGAMSVGLVKLGLSSVIPTYLYTISGLVILFFAVFKAGSVMFDGRTYEMQSSLPVSQAAIVVSRFLTMYIGNLALSLLVMLPGMAVYAINVHPAPSFYGYALIGILFLPMLPLTLATAFGAGIAAISARMRHKSLVSAGLSLLLVLVMLAAGSLLGSHAELLTEDILKNMAGIMTEKMGQLYPPAVWFGSSVAEGNVMPFLKLTVLSLGSFLLLMAVLQKFFAQICSALHANSAKNNYKMQSLSVGSALKALWKRELKRYFSSSIYVTNTIMSYLLMAVFAVALWAVGLDKIREQLPIPMEMLTGFVPFLLSLPAVIMPVTACSISMEGKQWWLLQTLPVKSKTVYAGKVLTNLTIALPFYIAAVIFALLTVKPDVGGALGIVLLPAAYIVFSAVAGLSINIRLPLLEWENDVRVVKQSMSALLSMLTGFVSVMIPAIFQGVLPVEWRFMVLPVTVLLLAVLSVLLLLKNAKIQLLDIAQK